MIIRKKYTSFKYFIIIKLIIEKKKIDKNPILNSPLHDTTRYTRNEIMYVYTMLILEYDPIVFIHTRLNENNEINEFTLRNVICPRLKLNN